MASVRRRIGSGLRRWVDAEDLEQESAVAWLERCAGLGARTAQAAAEMPEARRFAWSVVRNRLLHLAQRQRSQRRSGSLDEVLPEGEPECLDTAGRSDYGAEEVRLVARALRMLPADQRCLLLLREQFDLSWKTTSFILDGPVQALHCLRTRAIASLRRAMERASAPVSVTATPSKTRPALRSTLSARHEPTPPGTRSRPS